MLSIQLTDRELEILELLSDGLSDKEIALKLGLAPSSIRWNNSQIYNKMDITGDKKREQAVDLAQKLGLLNSFKSDEQIANKLPAQTTPFIGREKELQELTGLVLDEDVRLITILATGGMGKTRLSQEVARRVLTYFSDGVFFIPLASQHANERILSTIGDQIESFQPFAGADLETQLKNFLQKRRMLLILDNFEQLLDGAPIITDMLEVAPNIKVLVTSREKLNLSGEQVYSIGGLDFPLSETLFDRLENSAMQLFLQHARLVLHDFEITTNNIVYLHEICQLVAGMPLGLILAATWVEVLSLHEIVDEIRQSLEFLQVDKRDLPERQRSIHAVFDTTWKRLSTSEQQCFMKLSVFRGGFTREAAKVVAGASLLILQSLMSKALVSRTPRGRYEIHELLRQYAEEQLVKSGSEAETNLAYAQFFVDLAETSEPELRRARHVEVTEILEIEYDNLTRTMQWSLERHEPELALRIMVALRDFWLYGSNYKEGWQWYERGMPYIEGVEPLLQGRVFTAAANIVGLSGDFVLSTELAGRALDILYEIGNNAYIAWAMLTKVWAESAQLELLDQIATMETIEKLMQESGDDAGIARALNMKGHVFFNHKDYSRAYMTYEQCLEASRHTGEKRRISMAQYNMGKVAYLQADYKTSEVLIKNAIQVADKINFRTAGSAYLYILAGPVSSLGNVPKAATLIGAADAFYDMTGTEIQKGGGSDIIAKNIRESVHQILGDKAYETAYEAGRKLSFDEAVAYALSDSDVEES